MIMTSKFLKNTVSLNKNTTLSSPQKISHQTNPQYNYNHNITTHLSKKSLLINTSMLKIETQTKKPTLSKKCNSQLISTPEIDEVKQMTSFNFLYNPLKEGNIQEYLNERMKEQNLGNVSDGCSHHELFIPSRNHLMFKIKSKKNSMKERLRSHSKKYIEGIIPDSSQKEITLKEKQAISISPPNFHHPLILHPKSKSSYPHNLQPFRPLSMRTSASMFIDRKTDQNTLPLTQQINKSPNKVTPFKSFAEFAHKSKRKIRIADFHSNRVIVPERSDERVCVTPNNFLISRKKLGERDSKMTRPAQSNTKIQKKIRENCLTCHSKRKPSLKLTHQNPRKDPPQKSPQHHKLINLQAFSKPKYKKLTFDEIKPWQVSDLNPEIDIN